MVEDKSVRVARYHKETVKSFLDVLGATGLASQWDGVAADDVDEGADE